MAKNLHYQTAKWPLCIRYVRSAKTHRLLRLLFAKSASPHHGFAAFYTYLEFIFKAQTVVAPMGDTGVAWAMSVEYWPLVHGIRSWLGRNNTQGLRYSRPPPDEQQLAMGHSFELDMQNSHRIPPGTDPIIGAAVGMVKPQAMANSLNSKGREEVAKKSHVELPIRY